MNKFDNYQNTKYELEVFKKRLNLVLKYEKLVSEEKSELNEIICLQTRLLSQMGKDLQMLDGIENKLYSEIVIKGMKISKAIDKIAFEEEKDISTLWKNYYPKVKKRIDELYLIMDNDDLEKKEIFYLFGGDNYERNY